MQHRIAAMPRQMRQHLMDHRARAHADHRLHDVARCPARRADALRHHARHHFHPRHHADTADQSAEHRRHHHHWQQPALHMLRIPQHEARQQIRQALQQAKGHHPRLEVHQSLHLGCDEETREGKRGRQHRRHDRDDQGIAMQRLHHLRHHRLRLQEGHTAHVKAALKAVAHKIPPHVRWVMWGAVDGHWKDRRTGRKRAPWQALGQRKAACGRERSATRQCLKIRCRPSPQPTPRKALEDHTTIHRRVEGARFLVPLPAESYE